MGLSAGRSPGTRADQRKGEIMLSQRQRTRQQWRELDHWLRRRIRMGYWKQWRGVRNRIRQLRALGTRMRTAIWTGMSSKSYWHLSRSLGTQTGMTNDWLKRQGLISIRDQWMNAHGYA